MCTLLHEYISKPNKLNVQINNDRKKRSLSFFISNRQKPGRLQYICHKLIEICAIAIPSDREPPVTFWPVTVVIVNTISWHCYSIELQMASSDLANYITVNVECYKCTCAQFMVTYMWRGFILPLGASHKSSRVVTKVFQRYATHTLPTLQVDSLF